MTNIWAPIKNKIVWIVDIQNNTPAIKHSYGSLHPGISFLDLMNLFTFIGLVKRSPIILYLLYHLRLVHLVLFGPW